MSIRGYKMKRIIIIFIIVCVLLSFVEISYLAEENLPVLNGKFWNMITNFEDSDLIKGAYIRGVMDGVINTMIKIKSAEDRDTAGKCLLQLDFWIGVTGNIKVIIAIMDDLYKDSANTYIPFYSMCEIAYQKLKGGDIEPLLQEARKKALP